MRERDGQAPAPGGHPADPEVRLAEVDPDLAGRPPQRQGPLGVPSVALAGHLLAPSLHVALHGRAAALVALLVAGPHVDPRGRVALLAPVPAVVVEPGVDRPLVRREQLALRLVPPRGLGRQVLHPGVLPGRRLRHAERPRDRRDWLAAPGPFAHVLHLARAGRSPLVLPASQTEATTLSGRPRMVGVPMLKPEGFSCSEPKLLHAQIRNFEAIKHNSVRHANGPIDCCDLRPAGREAEARGAAPAEAMLWSGRSSIARSRAGWTGTRSYTLFVL